MRLSILNLCLLLFCTRPALAGWRILSVSGHPRIIHAIPTPKTEYNPIFPDGCTTLSGLPFSVSPAKKGGLLRSGDTICTPNNGSVLLEQGVNRYVLFPGSRIRITATKLLLKEGSLLRGDRSLTRNHSPSVKVTATPEYPNRGMACTLVLRSTNLATRPGLFLDRKWRSPFYRIGTGNRYRARFGVDCREWHREQPYRIHCRLKNGFLLEIRSSILLKRWKGRGRDILNEYSWSTLRRYAATTGEKNRSTTILRKSNLHSTEKNDRQNKEEKKTPRRPVPSAPQSG